MAFSTLLEQWLKRPLDWPALRSTPFTYAVMPDSLLSFDELGAFYERVQAAYDEIADGRHYLGTRPGRLFRPLSRAELPSWVNRDTVQGLVETAELAINLEPLRREIAAGVVTAVAERRLGDAGARGEAEQLVERVDGAVVEEAAHRPQTGEARRLDAVRERVTRLQLEAAAQLAAGVGVDQAQPTLGQ